MNIVDVLKTAIKAAEIGRAGAQTEILRETVRLIEAGKIDFFTNKKPEQVIEQMWNRSVAVYHAWQEAQIPNAKFEASLGDDFGGDVA